MENVSQKTVALDAQKPKEKAPAPKITYQKLFWLFFFGSLLGVLAEGVFCLVKRGRWETHVVSVWGPFCILYGIGAAGFYAGTVLLWRKNVVWRFVFFALVADLVELAAGLLLEFGLHMRAWSYVYHRWNVRGHISLKMSFAWGAFGSAFSYLVPTIDRALERMKGKAWNLLCLSLTVFMAINLSLTAVCLVRWKARHFDVPPANAFERLIDRKYDDAFMQKRFCEWRFLS